MAVCGYVVNEELEDVCQLRLRRIDIDEEYRNRPKLTKTKEGLKVEIIGRLGDQPFTYESPVAVGGGGMSLASLTSATSNSHRGFTVQHPDDLYVYEDR